MKTVAEINQLTREFWREYQLVTDRLMKKSMVLKRTVELVNEEDMHEPIYSRKPWDYLLRHSNAQIGQKMAARGRKARGVPKADPLTGLIRDIQKANPEISERRLWLKLRAEQGLGVVIAVVVGS